MTTITEIAAGTYRICTYVAAADLQFSQFLLEGDEPLLYHTGLRHHFPRVRDAVAEVLDPASLRWIGFSHFEADETGSLDEWLALAPGAEPLCGICAASVNVNDVAPRRARQLADGEVLQAGLHRLLFLATPHLPHGWDAGHLYDETTRVLFCSDLLHQGGDREAVTDESVVGRMREYIVAARDTPLDRYFAWSPQCREEVERLAVLQPATCAAMHGSVFAGDGPAELLAMADMLDEEYARPPA
jgi:flavorubredoxin